ncbi:MFS transporter [Agromyces mangrovi Wang et al. 2018]|uniref:MFS transporter n=1 Tax=Agromyces mangrovi TaxID=1858653 RepID=UPI003305FDE2|nr:hypothetical protein GCM10025877_20300 [Agromyces mangrovi]
MPAAQLGRATAITAAGGSVAGVLGVPLGNLLGQAFGWRAAFGALAVVAGVVVVLIVLLLPPVSPTPAPQRSARATRTDAAAQSALPGILLVCLIILFVVIGQTTYGTYSVVWLTDVASLEPTAIPLFLFGTGLAAFVSVTLIGRPADRFPNTTVVAGVALVVVLNVALPLAAGWGLVPLIVVALGQAMAFAIVPPLLQIRIMRLTPPRQRSSAAALQTTAFNIAIGGGAVVGAVVVGAWGLAALPWAAALTVAVGLCVLCLSTLGSPRGRTPGSRRPQTGRESLNRAGSDRPRFRRGPAAIVRATRSGCGTFQAGALREGRPGRTCRRPSDLLRGPCPSLRGRRPALRSRHRRTNTGQVRSAERVG